MEPLVRMLLFCSVRKKYRTASRDSKGQLQLL